MAAIDLQLNGYKGVDFNDDNLTAEALRLACQAIVTDGGQKMLATVITDHLDLMVSRIKRLTNLREQNKLIRDEYSKPYNLVVKIINKFVLRYQSH